MAKVVTKTRKGKIGMTSIFAKSEALGSKGEKKNPPGSPMRRLDEEVHIKLSGKLGKRNVDLIFSEADSGKDIISFAPSVSEYLGGKENLTVKTPLETEEDYIHLIRKGIRKKSLDYLIEATAITLGVMAAIMQTTSKELAAIKPNELLEKDQSEKAVNIARLYAMGEEAFGSAAEFNKWMNGRVPSLGKKRPKEFLDTSSGINLLMDEISRIQHGVYS